MSNLKKYLLVVLLVLVLPLVGTERNRQFLSKGDQLRYLKLINDRNDSIDLIKINKAENLLIVVISDLCYTCNKNFPIWNRLSSSKELTIFGIVNNLENLSLLKNTNLAKFPIFTPLDNKKFCKLNFEINKAVDYTVLLKKGKVEYFQIGQLQMDNYFTLKELINQ